MKLFRFLLSLDQKEANKYCKKNNNNNLKVKDTGVADRFLKF